MNRSILARSQSAGSIPQIRNVRRFFANSSRNAHSGRSMRLREQRPAATYFELLMSLPAKRTLPQLLHA